MFRNSAVSNRFLAEGIAGSTTTLLAARELAEGALAFTTPVAFIGAHAFRKSQSLEVIAPAGHQLESVRGFIAGVEPGWLKHVPTRVNIRVHVCGTAVAGGPVRWPDPRETDNFLGVPVLRLNAFLETELTRALNAPAGNRHRENAIEAILASGATFDRSLELHPFVMNAYLDAWEHAQAERLWPVAA